NGNPVDSRSLHYIHPHEPNQYMIALQSVGEIIEDYDTDKMFPALGFGAKVPPQYEVSHEFFLNFHPTDPLCRGVEGILAAYRQAIISVQLYGPTNFAPVIYHVAKFAQAAARDGSHYFVLLIVTDGIVTDMERTRDAIVHASALPMSIIIVGVGQEDFSAMEALDSDKQRLKATNGSFAQRDIVQFVPFRKYQHSGSNWTAAQAALAKEVLCEVPKQLTTWMRSRGIVPKPPPPQYAGNNAPAVPYPPGLGGAIPPSTYSSPPQNYAPQTAYSQFQGAAPLPPPPAYSMYSQAPTFPPPY
uniref:VWFA domain-containing protein n=1 Tax=Plectus sambesii TaxID=2011161 RepID=A0A914XQU7_9BILA